MTPAEFFPIDGQKRAQNTTITNCTEHLPFYVSQMGWSLCVIQKIVIRMYIHVTELRPTKQASITLTIMLHPDCQTINLD